MILRRLRLLSFRAHAESRAAFADKVNVVYGPNGAGKTNLLEAIHYLCLTKSFLASQDAYALRKGTPYFELEGAFEGDQRPELTVRLVYVPDQGKKVFINGAPLERLSQIIGVLPIVTFSPEDHAITAGGPDERRRLLDNVLSQSLPVYLDDLLKYRRALRQRNELLSQYRGRGRTAAAAPVLASWRAELVLLGSRVIQRRLQFVRAFSTYLERAYSRIERVAEQPTITYNGVARLDAEADLEAIAAAFEAELDRVSERERERGRTLVGPHRDDLVFKLNGLPVRRYASQGQHRTFGMALKLAQYFYLEDRLEERPILLLDDVFGHFDPSRTGAFLELLKSEDVGQSIITGTQKAPFAQHIFFAAPEHGSIHVTRGDRQADVHNEVATDSVEPNPEGDRIYMVENPTADTASGDMSP